MIDFLSDLLSPVTMIFALSSMLSVGLGYTLREVLGPLRESDLDFAIEKAIAGYEGN